MGVGVNKYISKGQIMKVLLKWEGVLQDWTGFCIILSAFILRAIS